MFNRPRGKKNRYNHSDRWRDYQSKLKKNDAKLRTLRRIPAYVILLCVLLLTGKALFKFLDSTLEIPDKEYSFVFNDQEENVDKETLQRIVNRLPLANSTEKHFAMKTGGNIYQVKSSLDASLQKFIIDKIDKKNSKHFGFIAMDPQTGQILSMVSYDRENKESNTCLNSEYPAASLFKIITAAAAIEKCGFTSETLFTFNGNKYTLYKRQLRDNVTKYTNKITFKKSFADSVNPVFGKIGKNFLGGPTLLQYAEIFGFNQKFDFEIPLRQSNIIIDSDPYSWAEIASGFNKKTLISPLHTALIVSSVVNNGKLIEPTLIDSIEKDGQILYKRSPYAENHVIDANTASTLKKMMSATISSGTASKSFRGFRRDKILSKLEIGGKTGSINNNNQHIKYDWFAGYAKEKAGSKKIVISVIVVHQDYIGVRASRYSRLAIKQYFKSYYANAKNKKSQKHATM